MRIKSTLTLLMILICFSDYSPAQLWSGLLKPTAGSGACSFGQVNSAGQCAVDWTQVGLPGGIPTNWTQSGSTIPASACGNGSSDCTSTIQSALNSCAGSGLPGKYVLLGPGNFLITGNLHVKNYCYLAGSGSQATVVMGEETSGVPVVMGAVNDDPYKSGTCTISAGNTAGSTSVTVSAKGLDGNPCGVGVGGYLVISELNNPVFVTGAAPQNPGGCGYCDVIWGGTRLREQIVEMTSVSGSGPYTVGVSPALYTDYGTATGTAPAYATPFGALNGGKPDCKYCGLENLQIVATGTNQAAGTADINMTECAYCFVYRVELNYTDGDWLDAAYCYRCEVRDNYFFNGYGHGAGGTDNFVGFVQETSASLMINNIMERGHVSIEVDLGAAGNVIAYNYSTGAVDAVATNVNELDMNNHGAYPQFNLWEGNVGPNFQPDSWHGNNGYNTAFRNWWRGSTQIATYPQANITSGSCSGGTCTINWASGVSPFYAGTYISIFGTNQINCGSGNLSTPVKGAVWQLTGSPGSLSSTFSSGGCTSWSGGFAFTNDLKNYPTPISHTGAGALSWSSTYLTYQGMWGMTIPAFSVGNNLLGNVLGSTDQVNTVGAGNMYNSGPSCTACIRAATDRPYSGEGYASSYNYDTSGDSNGSAWATFLGGPSNTPGYWSNQGFTTACYSSNYDAASESTINDINCTPSATLPPSFFLSGKPTWWADGLGGTNPPWPGIGPDVSGGPDSAVGNHANYNPAALCYINTSRDSTGAKEFNPGACYDNSNAPAPPTGLTAVVQ
jgi:hypothetical protein